MRKIELVGKGRVPEITITCVSPAKQQVIYFVKNILLAHLDQIHKRTLDDIQLAAIELSNKSNLVTALNGAPPSQDKRARIIRTQREKMCRPRADQQAGRLAEKPNRIPIWRRESGGAKGATGRTGFP